MTKANQSNRDSDAEPQAVDYGEVARECRAFAGLANKWATVVEKTIAALRAALASETARRVRSEEERDEARRKLFGIDESATAVLAREKAQVQDRAEAAEAKLTAQAAQLERLEQENTALVTFAHGILSRKRLDYVERSAALRGGLMEVKDGVLQPTSLISALRTQETK